jgi:hypothetical protein
MGLLVYAKAVRVAEVVDGFDCFFHSPDFSLNGFCLGSVHAGLATFHKVMNFKAFFGKLQAPVDSVSALG